MQSTHSIKVPGSRPPCARHYSFPSPYLWPLLCRADYSSPSRSHLCPPLRYLEQGYNAVYMWSVYNSWINQVTSNS